MTANTPRHVVLIPSYNTGPILAHTVRGALSHTSPVWVIVDGSTDGSDQALSAIAGPPALVVHRLPRNSGKGAALLHGLRAAKSAGFSHALTMDADGQHPPQMIEAFLSASRAAPAAAVFGVPQFGPDAPKLRVRGRRVSNWWAGLETLWAGIGDSLFGYRVYPIEPLLAIMERTRWMRRYDFDAEAAVRLVWAGIPVKTLASPVYYVPAEDGGVSHFRYGRDNVLLTWMHIRLMLGFLARCPRLLWRRAAG